MARNEASFSVSLLATLLLVAAATAEARVVHRINRRALYEMSAICEHASFPTDCRALIPTLSSPTPEALTEASVKVAISAGQEAEAEAAKFLADPSTSQPLKQNLEKCKASYESTLGSLGKAIESLKRPEGTHEDIMNNITEAVAFVGLCDDVFSQSPDLVSPVATVTANFERLASNSLSLAIGAKL